MNYNLRPFPSDTLVANELDDLLDSYSSFSSVRNRRDEEAVNDKDECHHRKRFGELCCGEDVVNKVRESEKDLKRACFKEIAGKDKPEKFDPLSCENLEHRKKQFTVRKMFTRIY